MINKIIVLLLMCTFGGRLCNAGQTTHLWSNLVICYNSSYLIDRDLRYPTTIEVLIDVIRKIEDTNRNLNARELSIALIRRYRQDGIVKGNDNEPGIPYSPHGPDNSKFAALLEKILPNGPTYDDYLDNQTACSLHYMISNTVETQVRNDENQVCGKIAKYQMRTRRAISKDIDMLASTVEMSDCPLEDGVVSTRWGAVKIGNVLAGIATGLNHQTVEGSESTFASTIAGDLCEAAMYSRDHKVGRSGSWNSTLLPQHYFIKPESLEVTDAEIRGDLDGLYLGTYLSQLSSDNSWKISQLLDAYYSLRAVDGAQLKACNRNKLQSKYAPTDKLSEQTEKFCYLLYDFADNIGTFPKNDIPEMVKKTVPNFNSYFTTMHDLGCNEADQSTQFTKRTGTELMVFVDTNWNFQIIRAVLSYVLQNIDVNKYDSSFRVFTGQGSEIVNLTNSITDFYRSFNRSRYDYESKDIDFNKVFNKIEALSKVRLNNNTINGGKSTIAVIVPHRAPNDGEKSYMSGRKTIFKQHIPDVKILVLGSAGKDSFGDAIPVNDVFTLTDNYNEENLKTDAMNIIQRIQTIPKNVVNPKCGSGFSTDIPASTFELTQYIEPTGLHYYRVAPNYFYHGGDKKLSVNIRDNGNLLVCMSRTDQNPTTTTPGVDCKNITSSSSVSYDLTHGCDEFASCQPYYLAVMAPPTSTASCRDELCRFPDNFKFTIRLENVQCTNSGSKIILGSLSSVLAILLIMLR